jgi:lambda repressor-like predicted transcriptional regulator
MRRQGLDEQQVDVAVQLNRQGWSMAQLGDRFGVDKRTVRSALRARGYVV